VILGRRLDRFVLRKEKVARVAVGYIDLAPDDAQGFDGFF
jgi:hypothetical protein